MDFIIILQDGKSGEWRWRDDEPGRTKIWLRQKHARSHVAGPAAAKQKPCVAHQMAGQPALDAPAPRCGGRFSFVCEYLRKSHGAPLIEIKVSRNALPKARRVTKMRHCDHHQHRHHRR